MGLRFIVQCLIYTTIMKKIYILAAILIWAAACHRAIVPANTPVINTEIKNESGQLILAGHCSPAAMQLPNYKVWFDKSFNSYAIDSAAVQQLKPFLKGKSMEIFLGSWCGDSKKEVPRMLKILETAGVDTAMISLIFVDNSTTTYKQSPQHEEKDKNIHHVPTFIIYNGKWEMGRIIEAPIISLEKDMLAILGQQPYKPNYTAIEYWRNGIRARKKIMRDVELQNLVAALQRLTKHTGEFNAYGYMQLAAKNVNEALNVFKLNTMIYPGNAGVFNSLGEAWETIGNKTEAVTAYQKALALKPADENTRKKIEQLKK